MPIQYGQLAAHNDLMYIKITLGHVHRSKFKELNMCSPIYQ